MQCLVTPLKETDNLQDYKSVHENGKKHQNAENAAKLKAEEQKAQIPEAKSSAVAPAKKKKPKKGKKSRGKF